MIEIKFHHSLVTLEQKEREEKDASRSKRLRIIILALKGFTAPTIALSIGLSRRICQRWIARYNSEGLKGLEDRRGCFTSNPLTPEQEAQFRARLEAGPMPEDEVCSLRGADVRRILKREFGVLRSLAGVYSLLHRLDYSYLRPRSRHRKSDPIAQEAFRKELPEKLAEIAKEYPQRRLRVYFQDESRFGQQGTTTNVWAPRGSRPTAVRQTEYDYLWVLGAVCPETGRAEGLLSPCLNTEVINVFLKEFSATLPENEQAVMIWDGAGFHRGRKLRVPENVSLIKLPPYSPELNPIENLWHYLKSHYWSNRAYKDYEALEQAAMAAWKKAALDPELMKTVCAAEHISAISD